MTSRPARNLFSLALGRLGLAAPGAVASPVPPAAALGRLVDFVAEAIRAAEETVGAGNGATKKELVLQACEAFFDAYIAPFDIPWVPNLVVEPYLDAKLRTLIRPLCGPLVDRLVAAFDAAPMLSLAAVTSVQGHDGRGNPIRIPVDTVG